MSVEFPTLRWKWSGGTTLNRGRPGCCQQSLGGRPWRCLGGGMSGLARVTGRSPAAASFVAG